MQSLWTKVEAVSAEIKENAADKNKNNSLDEREMRKLFDRVDDDKAARGNYEKFIENKLGRSQAQVHKNNNYELRLKPLLLLAIIYFYYH
jgi:hypothetical protein